MLMLCYLQLTFYFVFMTLSLMSEQEQKGVRNETVNSNAEKMNGCCSIYPRFLLT